MEAHIMFRLFTPRPSSTPPLRRRFRARLDFDVLEDRRACSVTPLPMVFDHEPSDTADVAAQMGDLSTSGAVLLQDRIGDSAAGAADVDWYEFTLDSAAQVHLTGSDAIVLSLYAAAPFDFFDPAAQSGVRLMAQADGTGLDRTLAAGTYYVAVSGHGNLYFHPFLADSGLDGTTGDYQVTVAADPLPIDPAAGPTVIAVDPGTAVASSPFVIRLTMSAPIDPNSAIPGDTVHLFWNPTGSFGDGNDVELGIDQVNYSDAAGELQIQPGAPLGVGSYEIVLAGNLDANFDAIFDPNGVPLGSDAAHPDGQDEAFTFQVTGVEGGTGAVANDTPAGAIELGDVSSTGLVQTIRAIGDDANDPVPFDPNDVDLYHFSLSGPGTYAVTAEVFARRIGSSLDPGVSLFRLDPSDGQLYLVGGNDNTGNAIAATNGLTLPLLGDSLVFAGLTAGDYYVAVSSRKNVPDADKGFLPGQGGIFDPNVSYSGTAGASTGPYVLNLLAQPDDVPPTVLSVTPGPGAVFASPPTEIVVRFSEDVDLQDLVFHAFEQTSQASIASVYIVGSDGTVYFPRLESYDAATRQATFLLLDRLAGGDFTLHLSGALGLTDLAGNPLVGTNGGDFTTSFTVTAPATGAVIASVEPNDVSPQDLGVLYPHDLQSGVTIVRAADPSRADASDSYRFQVLQDQNYFFALTGAAGLALTLRDDAGNLITTAPQTGGGQLAVLHAGSYVVTVGGWTSATASGTAYQLRIKLGGSGENPPPLTVGPAPALRSRLAPTASEAPPPPVVVLPTGTGSTTPTGNPSGLPSSIPMTGAPFAALAATPIGGISSLTDSATTTNERVVLPTPTVNAGGPTAGDRGVVNARTDIPRDAAFARFLVAGHQWIAVMWIAALDRFFATVGAMDEPALGFDGSYETSIEDADPALRVPTLYGLALGLGVVGSAGGGRRRRRRSWQPEMRP
jgi:hypothetical protein